VLGQLVDFEYFAGKTWEEDVEYMKTWTSNRLAWIDAQFVQPPRVTGTGSALLEPVAVPSSVGDGKSPLSNSPVLLQARGNNPSVALPDALLKTGLRNTNNWSTESAVPLQPPVFP
jgi:hypothetical protein